jgi:hypothetical protein
MRPPAFVGPEHRDACACSSLFVASVNVVRGWLGHVNLATTNR